MNDWLDQRRAWQFALIMACVVGVATTVTAVIVHWLLRGHLDPAVILGTAAGSMTGTFTVALGVRLTRPPKH